MDYDKTENNISCGKCARKVWKELNKKLKTLKYLHILFRILNKTDDNTDKCTHVVCYVFIRKLSDNFLTTSNEQQLFIYIFFSQSSKTETTKS